MEEIQTHLASQVDISSSSSIKLPSITHVGGLDIQWIEESDQAIVGAAICTYPDGAQIWADTLLCEAKPMAYKAGFLAFREVPLYQMMWIYMKTHAPLLPDLFLVDGNGILHPRRCGSASHFGVRVGIPTIGVAKNIHQIDGLSRQIKTWMQAQGLQTYPLNGISGREYGHAYISPKTKNPIYISPGHRVTLEDSLTIVSKLCLFREPEPLRLADRLARAKEREMVGGAKTKKAKVVLQTSSPVMRALRNKPEACSTCQIIFCPHRDFPHYCMKEGQRIPIRFYCTKCQPPMEKRSVRLDDDLMALLLGMVKASL